MRLSVSFEIDSLAIEQLSRFQLRSVITSGLRCLEGAAGLKPSIWRTPQQNLFPWLGGKGMEGCVFLIVVSRMLRATMSLAVQNYVKSLNWGHRVQLQDR